MISDIERQFLLSILENLDNKVNFLIYADWLEENFTDEYNFCLAKHIRFCFGGNESQYTKLEQFIVFIAKNNGYEVTRLAPECLRSYSKHTKTWFFLNYLYVWKEDKLGWVVEKDPSSELLKMVFLEFLTRSGTSSETSGRGGRLPNDNFRY